MNIPVTARPTASRWAWCLPILFAGCAADKPPESGFLGEYPTMVQSLRSQGAWVWVRPGANVSDYLKFIIDPVTVYMHADAQAEGVDPHELQDLADYFRDQIVARIASSGKYEIVDRPGDGVLRIRAALTGVVPSNVKLNITPATRWTGMGTGGASMEAEFIDTASEQRIAAVIASEKGNPVDVQAGMSKWGHTQEVMSKWALIIRQALDNTWISGGGSMRR